MKKNNDLDKISRTIGLVIVVISCCYLVLMAGRLGGILG